ncbi:hypothetical protein [Colwellia sp. C1TZA3]|uniref:hypothetical protein n=1 Tax=Colwellia sp. C1TZA3 TaxID=2508879 RepID=UPI0011B99BA9|nr:hypothetical protein [Colwellia sp. C1TZA3]TWX67484.1 hypothetical protein ESZ39_13405 [Colwellia sp. C1TZA3]
MNYLNTKLLLYILILCLSLGCQSQKADVKDMHKITIDKWQGLASYAKSRLNHYPVYIAASFTVEGLNRKRMLINKFQLTNEVNQTQIDLLSPSFKNKLFCNPNCHFFNEYIVQDAKVGATIASRLFIDYEFKLFQFYSQLFLLNDKIDLLENINKKYLTAYLQSIVTNNKKYNSLDDLTAYLNDVLTLNKFKLFLADPKNMISLTDIDNKENNIWSSNFKNKENNIWSSNFKNDENSLWSTDFDNKENSLRATDFGDKEKPAEILAWVTYLNNFIKIAKKEVEKKEVAADIEIGDTVCSFQNTLGTVVAIKGLQITVNEFALAWIYNDGLLENAPNGALHDHSNNFTFTAIENNLTRHSSKLFSCEIQ